MGLDTSSEAFVFQANKLFSPNVLRVQQGRAPSLWEEFPSLHTAH